MTNRVPSFRAIAVAILSNDHQLSSLGFQSRESAVLDAVLELRRQGKRQPQRDLWEAL
jgi:predicted phosphoadenosine phosphosulfate sulfurtransferase